MDQKKASIVRCTRKNGTKIRTYFLDHAFRWPKTFGTKKTPIVGCSRKNGAKKKGQFSGTKKGTKDTNIQQANPQLSMHIFKT